MLSTTGMIWREFPRCEDVVIERLTLPVFVFARLPHDSIRDRLEIKRLTWE